ncbi:MAG: helix-turn-helix transcriptional regulator [Methylohalobius sp. ZOD2]
MELMNVKETHEMLRCSRVHIYNLLNSDPSFPRPVRAGKKQPRWIKAEIEDWLLRSRKKEAAE